MSSYYTALIDELKHKLYLTKKELRNKEANLLKSINNGLDR